MKTMKLNTGILYCSVMSHSRSLQTSAEHFQASKQAGHKEKKRGEERKKEKNNRQAFYCAEKQSYASRQSRKPSDLVCVLPMELYELG
jgi:hypothetical protein